MPFAAPLKKAEGEDAGATYTLGCRQQSSAASHAGIIAADEVTAEGRKLSAFTQDSCGWKR